jgi:condensin-2 complex subunit D3
MEEPISRIIAELEEIRHFDNPTTPLSEPTLLDLQTLLDSNDSEHLDRLFEDLSSKSLSLPNHLVCPIALIMDSGPTHLSLLASKVYLSLLLSPNAPVFTLFTPMSFLSLLRSIRRSLKRRTPAPLADPEGSHVVPARRKRKGGGARDRGLRKNARNSYSESEESEFDVGDLVPVLERLELIMGLIHLDRFPDSLKSLVQTVAEIPVMAVELCGNSACYNRLTELCSRVLSEVLRPEHGDQSDTAAEVLKSLSPLILQLKSPSRTFALGFVTNRMTGLAKVSNGVKKAVVNFPRYLVQKAPEKSEPRALAVESIVEIVKVMEFGDRIGFVEYVVKMTQGKANLRLLAVDLILIFMMSLSDPLGVGSNSGVKDSWGLRCLEALILRCSDASTSIRARALSNLAQLVGFLAGDDKSQIVLKEVMGFGDAGEQILEGGMNNLLRKRCTDEKAAVRKAALVLITKLTALLGGAFDGALLKSMGMACSDPLVSIRKAAISALSEVSLIYCFCFICCLPVSH